MKGKKLDSVFTLFRLRFHIFIVISLSNCLFSHPFLLSFSSSIITHLHTPFLFRPIFSHQMCVCVQFFIVNLRVFTFWSIFDLFFFFLKNYRQLDRLKSVFCRFLFKEQSKSRWSCIHFFIHHTENIVQTELVDWFSFNILVFFFLVLFFLSEFKLDCDFCWPQ